MSLQKNAAGRYWNRPWSLVDGCTPCSPGCDHCWSAAMTHRFNKKTITGEYLTDENGRFGGYIQTHPDRLDIPLKRRKPTVYAVWNDLFHEEVPTTFIDDALEVMAARPRHTFLVLTKRAHLMEEKIYGVTTENPIRELGGGDYLPNVWLGLTVCNQQEAAAKIPVFLQVPGKKFLSIEPMLGPVDLFEALGGFDQGLMIGPHVDAVILGGETGPGARPMHPDWVRSVRDQCAAAGVPFFFKAWGEYSPDDFSAVLPSGRPPKRISVTPDGYFTTHSRAGSVDMMRVKSRLLDGRTHDDLPWVDKQNA